MKLPIIESWMTDTGINGNKLLVLATLYANMEHSQIDLCFDDMLDIAKMLNIGRVTVFRILDFLVKEKIIKIIKHDVYVTIKLRKGVINGRMYFED